MVSSCSYLTPPTVFEISSRRYKYCTNDDGGLDDVYSCTQLTNRKFVGTVLSLQRHYAVQYGTWTAKTRHDVQVKKSIFEYQPKIDRTLWRIQDVWAILLNSTYRACKAYDIAGEAGRVNCQASHKTMPCLTLYAVSRIVAEQHQRRGKDRQQLVTHG